MIQLNLRRTWSEIFTYLNSNPNPLRIVELINRVPPCCWTFEFTFEGTGRTTVHINCTHALRDNEDLTLIDGSLIEVFFADSLSLQSNEELVTVDICELFKNTPPSNQITLRNRPSQGKEPLLTLNGFGKSYTTPKELQEISTVQSYLWENTWLGSPDFANSMYDIRWKVFAKENVIQTHNRYINKLGSTDTFTTQTDLYNTDGVLPSEIRATP